MTARASSIRCLIVDDERIARQGLRRMLSGEEDLLVSDCGSGEEAVELIRAKSFELVFLDIQMRGMSGFEVIEAIGPTRMPVVVFTTAFDQHAIRAFEASAIDYLLKPIEEQRLAVATQRARAAVYQRRLGDVTNQMQALLATIAAPPSPVDEIPSFVIRSGTTRYRVQADAVDWVESADNYARLWTGKRSHLLRESLQDLEIALTRHGFLRVHRKALVNVTRLVELRGSAQTGYTAVLSGGERIPVSRERREDVLRAMRAR
jgi:two-component system LytT family response regulator